VTWNSNLRVVRFFFFVDCIKIEQNAEPSFSTSFLQELFENQNETTTKKKKERKNGGDKNQNNWNYDDLN